MIDQSLLVAYSAITVYGNVYLYSFLKKQTKNNIALKVSIKEKATYDRGTVGGHSNVEDILEPAISGSMP